MRRPSRQGPIPVCVSGTANISSPAEFSAIDNFPLYRRFPNAHLHALHPLYKKKEDGHVNAPHVTIPSCPDIRKTSSSILSVLRTTIFGLPFVMISVLSAAQPGAGIAKYFSAVRRGEHPIMPTLSHTPNADRYIDSIAPFLRDSVPLIRARAYEIIHAITSSAPPNTMARRRAATILVNACRDAIVENAGLALDLLTSFTKPDFSKAALDTFRLRVIQGSSYMDRAMKLAGFLGLDDLAPRMRSFAQPGHPTSQRWAALLSLARLGDEPAIAEIAKRVKKIPLSDRVVYDLFPDLIYTRRRELIDIAIDALLHDEKSCLSPNPEKEVPIPCGYRIMELLAPVIEDYPLALDETGDVAVDDYPAALGQVRQFFLTKKEFQINNDHY